MFGKTAAVVAQIAICDRGGFCAAGRHELTGDQSLLPSDIRVDDLERSRSDPGEGIVIPARRRNSIPKVNPVRAVVLFHDSGKPVGLRVIDHSGQHIAIIFRPVMGQREIHFGRPLHIRRDILCALSASAPPPDASRSVIEAIEPARVGEGGNRFPSAGLFKA